MSLARRSAYAGGAVVAGAVAFLGVLVVEGGLAIRATHKVKMELAPNPTGWYGARNPGRPITVALMGDSSAAGYGMTDVEDTPGAVLATAMADLSHHPVRLHDLSVIAAKSSDLHPQVEKAIAAEADVAVILVGANDVIRRVRPSVAVSHLEQAVRRLQEKGVKVLVGTVPDLGTATPILAPLRQVMRAWSLSLAARQTIQVVRAGGHTISLGDVLGPAFKARPSFWFGDDLFHPSAPGYHALGESLVPPLLSMLAIIGDEQAILQTYYGKQVMPLAAAALRAVVRPGTEIDPAPRPRGRIRRFWVRARKFDQSEPRRGRRPSHKAPAART
ncbi:MAG: SGNH/GDSL hydrolase family protein [Nocardioides sp.]|nr:SGNH/GDSL hydrolase family protein [Nocardioides sp.]